MVWVCAEASAEPETLGRPAHDEIQLFLRQERRLPGKKVTAPDVAAAGQDVRENRSPTCSAPLRRRGRRPPRTAGRPDTGSAPGTSDGSRRASRAPGGSGRDRGAPGTQAVRAPRAGTGLLRWSTTTRSDGKRPRSGGSRPRSVPAWSTQAIVPVSAIASQSGRVSSAPSHGPAAGMLALAAAVGGGCRSRPAPASAGAPPAPSGPRGSITHTARNRSGKRRRHRTMYAVVPVVEPRLHEDGAGDAGLVHVVHEQLDRGGGLRAVADLHRARDRGRRRSRPTRGGASRPRPWATSIKGSTSRSRTGSPRAARAILPARKRSQARGQAPLWVPTLPMGRKPKPGQVPRRPHESIGTTSSS